MFLNMRIILDEELREGALRADTAWELFFGTKSSFEGGHGMPRFAEWLWDELGEKAGNLNRSTKGEVVITIPSLQEDALDFVLRLVSFWGEDVRLNKGGSMTENLWKKPVVNVFDDETLDGAERAQRHELDDVGSIERNLMPVLGPGRAFYSVQVIEKGTTTARLHSHSALDEYYLILEGRGTLRFNGKEIELKRGDLIGKPAGPDATTHIDLDPIS
jgi:mannose-6-phosphate isomerase-like protein (cupin superfamily)